MIIKPKVRGFICVTAHPQGCLGNVDDQIKHIKSLGEIKDGPKKVLVVGSSTGYGLASRISAAFGSGASTLGVYFEKPGEEERCGTAGWYNNQAFEKRANEAGLYAKSINGDAFSDEIKRNVIEMIKNDLEEIDLLVYSLASPRRTHPRTGVTYKSVLKTIGDPFTSKTVKTDTGEVHEVTIEAASEDEVTETVNVMGGEDWQYWVEALLQANVLSDGFKTVAYSYIGPELTMPIYREGSIGKAKEALEGTVQNINSMLAMLDGQACISVNKALVTQASSAIPIVPLYVAVLYKVMKEKGIHEGCIEQMGRLFFEQLFSPEGIKTDDLGRIRMDDWELRPDVQEEVEAIWKDLSTENLKDVTDFNGYQNEFLSLFGFERSDINYDEDADPSQVK